jgi:hypothetical protein
MPRTSWSSIDNPVAGGGGLWRRGVPGAVVMARASNCDDVALCPSSCESVERVGGCVSWSRFMGGRVESACHALPCHAGGVQRPWRLSGGHCSEIGRHREGERARGSGLEVRTPTPYSPHRLQERDDADKRDRGVSEHEEEGWEHAQAVPMLGELARPVHAGRRACSRA